MRWVLEITQSFILYCATWDTKFLLASKQIDGLRFFNSDLKIAGPSDNVEATYKNLENDIKRKDAHMNIRIGSSATKEDVIWFINKYWKSDIEPVSNPSASKTPTTRGKTKKLRDLTVYALKRNGRRYGEIQKYIDDNYGDFLELAYLRKVVERTTPEYSLFDYAAKQLPTLLSTDKPAKSFELELIKDGKNSHFKIIKM